VLDCRVVLAPWRWPLLQRTHDSLPLLIEVRGGQSQPPRTDQFFAWHGV
jgi:hypothetical protein